MSTVNEQLADGYEPDDPRTVTDAGNILRFYTTPLTTQEETE